MSSLNERQALARVSLILLGLVTLTATLPVVGYVLLGLLILAVLGLVGGFAAMWWQTRWQPLDDRPTRLPASSTEADEREVA